MSTEYFLTSYLYYYCVNSLKALTKPNPSPYHVIQAKGPQGLSSSITRWLDPDQANIR